MKLCECGCGQPAPIATITSKAKGWIAGQPKKYVHRHRARVVVGDGPNPTGFCMCGCGGVAPVALKSKSSQGIVAGRPARYIHGHNAARSDGITMASNGYPQRRVSADHPLAAMRNSAGNVLMHRFVMAEAIGRALSGEEVVHHIDEDRSNYSLDNLMLFASNADHHKHHHALRRAAKEVM